MALKENKVEFGLNNVYYAIYNETTKEYETPKRLKGAVNLTLSGEGEDYVFYADNMAYYSSKTNNGYSGDGEFANLTVDFYKDLLGWELDQNGALVEIADAKQVPFALLFEVEGDEAKRKVVYYYCKVGKTGDENKTIEGNKEVATKKFPISILPLDVNGKMIVKSSILPTAENKTKYDGFYNEVYLPVFGE